MQRQKSFRAGLAWQTRLDQIREKGPLGSRQMQGLSLMKVLSSNELKVQQCDERITFL
jgi:hypothetical protein